MASIILLVGDTKEYVFKSIKVADANTENGSAVALGATTADGKDVYTAVKPATANLATASYLVAKEFIKYVGNEKIDELVCKANEIVKGVHCKIGQEVVVSNDAVKTGTPTVDYFVSPTNGEYKMAITSTQTASVVAYRIIAINEPIRVGQRTITGFRMVRVA